MVLLSDEELAQEYALRYVPVGMVKLMKFKHLVELHFREQHDPKFYAGGLGVSYRHLSGLTLAAMGKTPNELLQDRLHLEAERLLRFTSLTIKEITYELGVCDPSHFCRSFRKHSGMSPTAFRELYFSGVPVDLG